jgi:CRISPR-associated endonuclease/helicase Cas3
MKPPITRPWGKLQHVTPGNRESPLLAWLPLEDHCADVAACAVALLGLRPAGFTPTVLNRRLARLGGLEALDEVQVARMGVLAGLHDVGKCNRGFQNHAFHRQPMAGHVGEMVAVLANPQWRTSMLKSLFEPDMDAWAASRQTVLHLWLAALSHHGRPAEPSQQDMDPAVLWQDDPARKPLRDVAALVASTRMWLPQAWTAAGTPLPDQPGFAHAFCGLVQLADWIASDAHGDAFPFDGGPDRWAFAWERTARLIPALGLDGAKVRPPQAPGFDRISGFNPRGGQSAIGALSLPTAPSLTLLEDETGAGKTEAALWHFARLFQAGTVDGLYFALPTRTAARQLHQRVREVRDRLFQDRSREERPAVILAVPGYLEMEGCEGKRLPGFEVLWSDHQRDPRRWAAESPKRYLAGTLVVGTIDQILLAALAVNHSHLRSTCLLRHLVVIDEVHASDAYMTRIAMVLLERLRQAGGHALLLSATLGQEAAARLWAAWEGGSLRLPSLAQAGDAQQTPYPALTRSMAGVRTRQVIPIRFQRQVRLDTQPADHLEAIIDQAAQAAGAKARVLILRNTVSDCLDTQQALEAQVPAERLWRVATAAGKQPVPHHARYAREDRAFLDRELERVFGKQVQCADGCIACATQTVQQSLDLDADLLITDLCPVDVLLQRLGRLHRHDRNRPAGYTEPRAIILLPEEPLETWLGKTRGPHGWGTVYQDLAILEATRRLVEEGAWTIPTDNRRLVEAATHREALDRLATTPAWQKHRGDCLGCFCADQNVARLNLNHWEHHFPISAGNAQGVRFPSGDLAQEIRTRLGEDDRRVTFPDPIIGPFNHPIAGLTIPGWWLAGVKSDAEPGPPSRDGQTLRIHYPDRNFLYDRLGLRRERRDADDDLADA